MFLSSYQWRTVSNPTQKMMLRKSFLCYIATSTVICSLFSTTTTSLFVRLFVWRQRYSITRTPSVEQTLWTQRTGVAVTTEEKSLFLIFQSPATTTPTIILMNKAEKFYAIVRGRRTGIVRTWEECRPLVRMMAD
jgi:Caulimovirus viroplasmin